VRTNPAPPRRPDGISITKGVRIQNVRPQNVEKWICKIAKSRADELARKRCPRSPNEENEEKRLRLLGEEPNGTPTFPQSIPTSASQHPAWQGEAPCDPRTAMSLRPGPGLIMGLVKGAWEGLSADSVMDEDSGSVLDANRKKHGANNPITHNELFTAVQESWKFNWDGSMPVTQVSQKRWEDLMEHQPITVFADDKTYRYDHPFKPEKDLTVWVYYREKRVKLIRNLSDGLRSWIEKKGERILVNRADLGKRPKPSKQQKMTIAA
jgi:hypothetical protein